MRESSYRLTHTAKLGLLNDWKEVVYARSESVGVRAPRGQCNYARDYVRDSVGRDLFLTLPWQLTRRIFLVSRKTLDIFIFLFHKWNLSLLLLFFFFDWKQKFFLEIRREKFNSFQNFIYAYQDDVKFSSINRISS